MAASIPGFSSVRSERTAGEHGVDIGLLQAIGGPLRQAHDVTRPATSKQANVPISLATHGYDRAGVEDVVVYDPKLRVVSAQSPKLLVRRAARVAAQVGQRDGLVQMSRVVLTPAGDVIGPKVVDGRDRATVVECTLAVWDDQQ